MSGDRPAPTRASLVIAAQAEEIALLKALLREWRDLADLPGGGFGGTLKQRTDTAVGGAS